VIKEALEFLAHIQTPKNPIITSIDALPYTVKADGTLGDLIRSPVGSALEVRSLGAIMAAYRNRIDGLEPESTAFHVVDPLLVELIALELDEYGRRHVYARARHAPETGFEFGTYYAAEDFIIKFRSSFYFNEQAAKVQQLCSTLDAGSTVSVSDDGMSQTVVVSQGSISKASVTLPAEGVRLIPWRTFREAAPVESSFLLRMKSDKVNVPRIALFELDKKWEVETVHSIADYLAGLVSEDEKITILV
jgi:hypothetical protein